MVRRFFSTKQLELGNDEPSQLMLLSGPPNSGKTSIMFQFAYNSANSNNGYVVFICNKRRLESKPPYLSQGNDPSSDVYQRIQMKYVDDDEGIKRYFAAFHLQKEFPVAVVVDDFGEFFDDSKCQERYRNQRGRDLAIVRTLALCRNSIMHANEKSEGQTCKLLLSDTQQGETPRMLFIYKRWIPSIFTIKGDGSGSFLLNNSSLTVTGLGKSETAKYSIALQYLVLEGITEETETS
ncbi:hypothetical protein GIB67_004034 [Kingdonia uniflora]|uniref:Uncharacterized protein n=1 Tax=Kingdonia uniflora TaxID=39325 RepID=A0A7J7NRP9_9MAGN|nr:hypothetical protein GIB67_004034 [Kingdonia uniflora]